MTAKAKAWSLMVLAAFLSLAASVSLAEATTVNQTIVAMGTWIVAAVLLVGGLVVDVVGAAGTVPRGDRSTA